MPRVTQIVIDPDDAKRYRESIRAVQKRMVEAFNRTDDLAFRKWINKHGAVLDELADELKLR